MPKLFPGDLVSNEKPYDSLASMSGAFAKLKYSTSPAIYGDAFVSAAQTPGSRAPSHTATPATAVSALQRAVPPRNLLHTMFRLSRRDLLSVDYSLWPFDDKGYTIICTLTNHMLQNLWILVVTEEVRRQACIKHLGSCCNFGFTERSLSWCTAPSQNAFPHLDPEFAARVPEGFVFGTWQKRMRNWRRKAPQCRHQGNVQRNASGNALQPPQYWAPSGLSM